MAAPQAEVVQAEHARTLSVHGTGNGTSRTAEPQHHEELPPDGYAVPDEGADAADAVEDVSAPTAIAAAHQRIDAA